MNLTFHLTFGLNFRDVSNLVEVIIDNPNIDNYTISDLTGIGIGQKPDKGKVAPTIKWACFGGVINQDTKSKPRKFTLTSEGVLIRENDAYFQSPITSWIIHYHLSKPHDKSAWHYLIHKFLPERYEFTMEDLKIGLSHAFPSIKIKSINPGILLSSYTKDFAMKPINLIEDLGKERYRKGIPSIPNSYIAGYILAKIWEREHMENVTLSFDALQKPNHLLSTMNISIEEALNHLETLKEKGVLDLMRAVKPFQIVRSWKNPIDILKLAYGE